MRYLVTDGYKHISKPDAIIITNVFSQASIKVTREAWVSVIGSDLPYIRNDTRISKIEISQLRQLANS